MSRFVLVHGAWHGPWCWERVAGLIEDRGHMVQTPDLTAPTLASRVDQVAEALAASDEPAILAGHSLGGVVITQAAEQVPERIARLVYLAAYLPAGGQSLLSLAVRDGDSVLVRGVRLGEGGPISVKPALAHEAFYNDCTPQDAVWAAARLRPEPSAILREPVSITAERFGTVPRLYLRCAHDRAITPALQDRMLRVTPCAVQEMECGHCPFVSAPEELAGHLLESAVIA